MVLRHISMVYNHVCKPCCCLYQASGVFSTCKRNTINRYGKSSAKFVKW